VETVGSSPLLHSVQMSTLRDKADIGLQDANGRFILIVAAVAVAVDVKQPFAECVGDQYYLSLS
jgi:hypothetical protein